MQWIYIEMPLIYNVTAIELLVITQWGYISVWGELYSRGMVIVGNVSFPSISYLVHNQMLFINHS